MYFNNNDYLVYSSQKTATQSVVVSLLNSNYKLFHIHFISDLKFNEITQIITEESILTGDGFEADQNFEKWTIKKSSGIIDIVENEENETEEDR